MITYGLNVLARVVALANKRVYTNSSGCPPLLGDVSVQVLTGHVKIVGSNGILFPVHGIRWHNLIMAQDRLWKRKREALSTQFRSNLQFHVCQSNAFDAVYLSNSNGVLDQEVGNRAV